GGARRRRRDRRGDDRRRRVPQSERAAAHQPGRGGRRHVDARPGAWRCQRHDLLRLLLPGRPGGRPAAGGRGAEGGAGGRARGGGGASGGAGVAFAAVKRGALWRPYAAEITLRGGGTTPPLLALTALTDGAYEPLSAEYRTRLGDLKRYVATDHLDSPAYRS